MFEDNPGNAPQTGATPGPTSFPDAAGMNSRVSRAPSAGPVQHPAGSVGVAGRGLLRRIAAALLVVLPALVVLAPEAEAHPPDAPTGLSARLENGDRIFLSWTAPGDDGGSPIDDYQYRRREAGASYGGPIPFGSIATSSSFPSSIQGDIYQVRAVNEIGPGAWSAEYAIPRFTSANTDDETPGDTDNDETATPINADNDETPTPINADDDEAVTPPPLPANIAATGAPSIDGTARVGQTLTAGAGTIADADGLARVSYSWRWLRVDGSTETIIPGATSMTYMPVDADIGRTLKVSASFTDDAGNAESRTSAETATVATALTAPVRRAPEALAAVRWLARFGRTVADHVMAAVGARPAEPQGQGDRLRLAGHRVGMTAALFNPPPAGREGPGEGLSACADGCGASPAAALDAANVTNGGVGVAGLAAGPLSRPLPAGGERGTYGPGRSLSLTLSSGASRVSKGAQTMAAREALAGSSFRLSGGGEGMADTGWTAWGRVDLSRFDGDEGGLALDGDTMTATVGADMRRGRLLAGVAAAHSSGNGDFRAADGGAAGDLGASLASVHPYVRVDAAGGLSLWGVLGWGEGDMTLDRRDGDNETADLEMTMAGAGARGPLPAPTDGMALALRAEAFASQVEADGGGDALREAEAEAWRMRLALEASWDETEAGLRPSAELGLRHDGGDGETGTGAELGGGVAWAGPDGLSASLRARALLDGDGVSEWGGGAMLAYAPGGADGRGLRLSLAPSMGVAEGGAERLWRADMAALAGDDDAAPRLDAEAGYGFAVMGGRGLLTPHAGLGLSDAEDRRYRLGARLTLAPGAALGLAAERAETGAGPEHALTLDARLRW